MNKNLVLAKKILFEIEQNCVISGDDDWDDF